ncbi:MAG: transposase [Solirubrobacteraceae bacterium]
MPGMPQNFIACDRGQTLLLPPDLTDWVPDDHVVWSILGAVDQMDLSAFYGAYRENGQGRAAYEPSMVVALLLYAYARGNRSSRGIERACREDVTYKLITAMRVPDHSTIAEFRRRHERALGELFTAVLALCEEAGLVEVGVISVDGTKIRANASRGANRTYERLVADILKEAEETDRWEDGLFGADRGDELPEHLRTEEGRRAAFKAAKERWSWLPVRRDGSHKRAREHQRPQPHPDVPCSHESGARSCSGPRSRSSPHAEAARQPRLRLRRTCFHARAVPSLAPGARGGTSPSARPSPRAAVRRLAPPWATMQKRQDSAAGLILGMRVLRESSKAEMVSVFLQGELFSERFGSAVRDALRACGARERLLTDPDLHDMDANRLRGAVLAATRGYGEDRELFEHFPAEVHWAWARMTPSDLAGVRYIEYSYWNELSGGSRFTADAARRIKAGVQPWGVSNEPVRRLSGDLLSGARFPPLILAGRCYEDLVCLEGNVRLTAHARAGFPIEIECLVGIAPTLERWAG